MDEEPKRVKQNLTTKFIVAEPLALDGADLIPVRQDYFFTVRVILLKCCCIYRST